MNAEEITQKLVTGSKNLDCMKQEVISVVNTVLGLLKPIDFVNRREEIIATVGCHWKISPCVTKLTVQCVLVDSDIGGSWHSHCAYYSIGNPSISLYDVKRVHKALPVFVAGMRHSFPCLVDRWQPILDAAD